MNFTFHTDAPERATTGVWAPGLPAAESVVQVGAVAHLSRPLCSVLHHI